MTRGGTRRLRRRLWHNGWPDHPGLKAEVELTIPFHDADPTGVAWHGNYFRYYDAARTELLAKLRISHRQLDANHRIWPIVDTRVRYCRSISHGTTVTVSGQLVEWDFRIVIYYEVEDSAQGLVNEAYTVQVPVSTRTDNIVAGTPQSFRTRICEIIGQ